MTATADDHITLSKAVFDAALSVVTSKGDRYSDLLELLQHVAASATYERAALVAYHDSDGHARVVCATDEPGTGRSLALAEYPELVIAAEQKAAVVIPDVANEPITSGDRRGLETVGSLVVHPIVLQDKAVGALFLRDSRQGLDMSEAATRDCEVAAAFLSPLMPSFGVREDTQRISRISYESERRERMVGPLRDHFEASSEGVFVVDSEGILVFANRVAEDITGFAQDGLVGQALSGLLPDLEEDECRSIVADVIAGNNLEAFDLYLSTTSESQICVSVNTSTVLSRGGAAVLSFRDVTEKRLLQEQLKEEQKRALVAQLAGTAAHELNQPLTSILAYCELIHRKHELSQDLQQALGVISSEAERMAGIVKNIGKITNFETVPYVGSTTIVDLKASRAPSSDIDADTHDPAGGQWLRV